MTLAVLYYRISTNTRKQKWSLQHQREISHGLCASRNWRVLAEYREQEGSRDKDDRPVLQQAIAHCRRSGARLVVACIDRLTANLSLIAHLENCGVQFTCADMPEADETTIKILAIFANREVKLIRKRIKNGFQQGKASGKKYGAARPGFKPEWRQKGLVAATKKAATVNRARGKESLRDLYPILKQMLDEGETWEGIAKRLNVMGHCTARGLAWKGHHVGEAIRKMERDDEFSKAD